MLNRMNQEAGEKSTNIQAAGDIYVGITVTDALAISRDVVKQELQLYTNEALNTAEARFNEIANKAIDKISTEKPNLFPKFKDPSIQLALNETYKKYIETGDEELGDNLINMLIDRLEVENRNTKQFIIDDARNILPKLSISNLSFLALQVFSMLSIPTNNRNEYKVILEKIKKITYATKDISNLDIMYLKQSGCVMGVPMIHVTKKIADSLLNTYEYYFSDGININTLNELFNKHRFHANENLLIKALSLCEPDENSQFRMRFASRQRFDDFFEENNIPEIKNFLEEFISTQPKADVNKMKEFHVSIGSVI